MNPKKIIVRVVGNLKNEIQDISKYNSKPIVEIELIAKGSLIKSYEFLTEVSLNTSGNCFFLLSSLRGICEDLISIAYIKNNLSESELKDLFDFNTSYVRSQALTKQFNFFKQFKPSQRVVHPRLVIDDNVFKETKNNLSESQLKKIARTKRVKTLPSVKDMAEKSDYTSLYKYIYYMTSAFVHFRFDNFMKLCWGKYNENREIEEFKISTLNQNNFSRELCLCYGSFLFCEIIKQTKSILNLSKEINKEMSKLEKMLEDYSWPPFFDMEYFNLNGYELFLRSLLYDKISPKNNE